MALKYKVGNKVRIKSLDWYNENKDEFGVVLIENGQYVFFESDTIWCGKVITIVDVCLDEYYTIAEDHGKHRWTDEMIEGLVEENITDVDKSQDDNEIINIIDEYIHHLESNECQIDLPEGYQFTDEDGNIINATKIIWRKENDTKTI